MVSDISTMDIQIYIRKQIKDKKAANTINLRIASIKAMYNWALDNEIINNGPNLKVIKKITKIKKEKLTFTAEQIQQLLETADIQMKAMILLGLNCGFGYTDCAELKWENLDFEKNRVIYPRGKTGVSRNLSLWSETVEALKKVPRKGVYVCCKYVAMYILDISMP
ncbi:MAG: tyrosine-type recombinase/integrase [Phycisphaerales bacterium]